MRFLADENVPDGVVTALAAAGHDVVWSRTAMPGAADRVLLDRAIREARILLTFDAGFVERARASALPSRGGVVLLRMPLPGPGAAPGIADVIAARADWAGRVSVIEPDAVNMGPLRRDWVQVSLQEIRSALDFVDHGMGNQAFLNRATGAVLWRSELGDELDELPEDIDESDEYVALPDRRELDLGRRLVLAFADEVMPRDADEIARIFSRKGAYGRFKDLLHRRGMLDRWYAFEEAAIDKALRAWCEDNEIEPVDGPPPD